MAMSRLKQLDKLYLKKVLDSENSPTDKQVGYNETVLKTLRVVFQTLKRSLPEPDFIKCACPGCDQKFRPRKGKLYCSSTCRAKDFVLRKGVTNA